MRNSKPSLPRSENPRDRHVAGAVADERDHFAGNRAELFLERKNIGENLAGMLVIGERVDGRDFGVFGENLRCRVGANVRMTAP